MISTDQELAIQEMTKVLIIGSDFMKEVPSKDQSTNVILSAIGTVPPMKPFHRFFSPSLGRAI